MKLSNLTTVELGSDGYISTPRARKPWIVMIWMLAIAPVFSVIMNPRVFDPNFAGYVAAGDARQGILSWLLGKLTGYGIIAVSIFMMVMYRQKSRHERFGEARKLSAAIIAYSLVPILVTLFSKNVRLNLGMLALPVVFTATYNLPAIRPGEIAKHLRIALAVIYIYGTLIAIAVAPKWAIELGYSTELSYVVYRLYGMAIHANILAAFLFVFIVLGWMPGARLRMEKLHLFLAIILMVAAQSKTIMLILIIVLLLKISSNHLKRIYSRKVLRYSLLLVLPLSALTAITLALQNKVVLEKIQNPEVMTLTGRLMLWVITYSLWLERPWFGYGAAMWNSEMQLEYSKFTGGWLAPHAHNQFLQTLGESGLVGAILLLIVYYLFGKASWTLFSSTNGVSLYLFIYLVLRSLTEVPIVLTAGQSNFLNLWSIFAILMTSHKLKARHNMASKNAGILQEVPTGTVS